MRFFELQETAKPVGGILFLFEKGSFPVQK